MSVIAPGAFVTLATHRGFPAWPSIDHWRHHGYFSSHAEFRGGDHLLVLELGSEEGRLGHRWVRVLGPDAEGWICVDPVDLIPCTP